MNEIRISGRLTREPEVRQLENTTLAVAPLVINEGYKTPTGEHRQSTTFVDVQLWGEDAEKISKLPKGQEVQFIGSLRQRQWEDKQTGQKRTKLYVKAWEWEAIERERAHQAKTAPEMER
jgi:single-strand DNA-binding protein